eukprot:4789745-Pyramimonas_sp.AAC.1
MRTAHCVGTSLNHARGITNAAQARYALRQPFPAHAQEARNITMGAAHQCTQRARQWHRAAKPNPNAYHMWQSRHSRERFAA